MTTEDAARARARRPAGMSSAEEAASMNTRAYGSVGGSLSDLTCALLETRDAAWAAELQRLWDERDALAKVEEVKRLRERLKASELSRSLARDEARRLITELLSRGRVHPPNCSCVICEDSRAFLAATPAGPLPPEVLAVMRDPSITLPGEELAMNLLLRSTVKPTDAAQVVLLRGCKTCLGGEHPYWHPADRPCPVSADTPAGPGAPLWPPKAGDRVKP